MITAWDVYWVMQLDSIGAALAVVAVAAGVSTVALVLFGAMEKDLANPETDSGKRHRARGEALHRLARKVAVVAGVALMLSAFLPSSKTAAAMIVLPALTSESVTEPLAKEAAELYGLAKKALAEVAEGEPAKEAD